MVFVMRLEIASSTSSGMREYVAVMPSTDETARTATVLPYALRSPWTPTDLDGSSTAKYCHGSSILPSAAALAISSSTM